MKKNKPTDFLKQGHDVEFDKAMNSINEMYDDLFKTTDFNLSSSSYDQENLGKFDSLNQMWNDIMDVKPEQPKQVEQGEEIIMGEPIYEVMPTKPPRRLEPLPPVQHPIDYSSMRQGYPKIQTYATPYGSRNPYQ